MTKNNQKFFLILLSTTLLVIIFVLVGRLYHPGKYTQSSQLPSSMNKVPEDKSFLGKKYEEIIQEVDESVGFDRSKPFFVDGSYKVGEDILPGTYRTRSASWGCSFERLSNEFAQNDDQIISNGVSSYPLVVTIDKSDVQFISDHCVAWTQDLSQITQNKTSFGSGMYIVGTDVEPGIYTNSNPTKSISGCQYKRLSGFSGEEKDIIYEWAVDGTTEIEIETSDKGFWSEGCGTWTKK